MSSFDSIVLYAVVTVSILDSSLSKVFSRVLVIAVVMSVGLVLAKSVGAVCAVLDVLSGETRVWSWCCCEE